MPAFNFQLQFAPRIAKGKKQHTIRETLRCKVGDTMYLYVGMRTGNCKKLAEKKCTYVYGISIWPRIKRVVVYNNPKTHRGLRLNDEQIGCLARADGFLTKNDFFRFFESLRAKQQGNGTPYFYGYIYGWKKLPWYLQKPSEAIIQTASGTFRPVIQHANHHM